VQAPLLKQRLDSSTLAMLDANIRLFTSTKCLFPASRTGRGAEAAGGADLFRCGLGASGKGVLGPGSVAIVTGELVV
jgi:hypothetical protein